MKTLTELKRTTEIQYALERFIELYDKSNLESEKYFVKHELTKYLIDSNASLPGIMSYLSLQPEKFSPFISLLKDIEDDTDYSCSDYSVRRDCKRRRPVDVFTVVFGERKDDDDDDRY